MSNDPANLTQKDGRQLALQMIKELENNVAAELEPEYRQGRAFDNVLLRYLDRCRGNGDVMAGFTAILTGYISCTAAGTVPDISYLAQFIDA